MTSLDGSPYVRSLWNGRRTVRGRRRKATSSVQRSPRTAADHTVVSVIEVQQPEDLSCSRVSVDGAVATRDECDKSNEDLTDATAITSNTLISVDDDVDDDLCQTSGLGPVHPSSDVSSGNDDDDDNPGYNGAMLDGGDMVSRVHLTSLPQLLPSGYVYREPQASERQTPVKSLILSPGCSSILYPTMNERPASRVVAKSNLYGNVSASPTCGLMPEPGISVFLSKMASSCRPVTMVRLMGGDGHSMMGGHGVLSPAAEAMQSKPNLQDRKSTL